MVLEFGAIDKTSLQKTFTPCISGTRWGLIKLHLFISLLQESTSITLPSVNQNLQPVGCFTFVAKRISTIR